MANNAILSLMGIFLISTIGGMLLVKLKKPEEKQVKLILFALYFWLLAFIQLALAAVIYYLHAKYNR